MSAERQISAQNQAESSHETEDCERTTTTKANTTKYESEGREQAEVMQLGMAPSRELADGLQDDGAPDGQRLLVVRPDHDMDASKRKHQTTSNHDESGKSCELAAKR